MVCAVLGLALMIPAAPGALGTYEFFSSTAITIAGLTAANALALTFALHGWVLLTTSITGILCAGSGLSLRNFVSRPSAVPSPERAVAVGDSK